MRKVRWLLLLTAVVVLLAPSPAHAYIGPGAGFALAGSFLADDVALQRGTQLLTICGEELPIYPRTSHRSPYV